MKQHHIDENSLRDLGELNTALGEMKRQEIPDAIQNQIWQQIRPEMLQQSQHLKKRAALKTFFQLYRSQLITAFTLIIVATVTLIFTQTESKTTEPIRSIVKHTKTTPPQETVLKAGGTILADQKTAFKVIHSTPEAGEVFLTRGTVSVSVTPSQKRKRFEIHTSDAIVAVKGTEFNVTKHQQHTEVSVTEGTVWVTPAGKGRSKLILHAGDHAKILPLNLFLKQQRTRGMEAFLGQNYTGARQYFTPYLANKTADWEIVTITARIATIEKRYQDALDLYQQIIDGASGITRENSWMARGMLLKQIGRTQEARKLFQNYLKTYPAGTYTNEIKLELDQ